MSAAKCERHQVWAWQMTRKQEKLAVFYMPIKLMDKN